MSQRLLYLDVLSNRNINRVRGIDSAIAGHKTALTDRKLDDVKSASVDFSLDDFYAMREQQDIAIDLQNKKLPLCFTEPGSKRPIKSDFRTIGPTP